jgi:hypothetical protein
MLYPPHFAVDFEVLYCCLPPSHLRSIIFQSSRMWNNYLLVRVLRERRLVPHRAATGKDLALARCNHCYGILARVGGHKLIRLAHWGRGEKMSSAFLGYSAWQLLVFAAQLGQLSSADGESSTCALPPLTVYSYHNIPNTTPRIAEGTRMARTTALVDGATLVVPESGASPIMVDTPAWFACLEHATTLSTSCHRG